jgi:carboxyl-terminal processing protease
MPRWNLAWLLGISAVCMLGLAVCYSAPQRDKDENYELVKLMVDVMQEVDHKYVQKLDKDRKRKLVEDMINGGLDRLDPHSTFINAKDYKQFTKQSKGKFGGIGIQIGYDRLSGGQLSVISPMVGTPAYDAGILAGDLIVKIDGKSTENMRLSEAVELIQGDPGQKLTLSVIHEGTKDAVDVPLVRAEIQVQSVLGDRRKADDPKEWEYFVDPANKIAYIRLTQFSETAAVKEGVRGLVLDLRNNPGGLLSAAVEISDMFLKEGRIVSTKGRNAEERVYEAKEAGTLLEPAKDYPIAILVNRFSASASEIVSAALQDNHRAVIVGERSFGKGSVQNIIEMEGRQSALKLTTASYWRPSEKNIHRFPDAKETDEWGVRPNDSGYLLNSASLAALKEAGLPEAILGKLKDFPAERYPTEQTYTDALTKHLGLSAEEMGKYRSKFVEHADRGFEVVLKDDERLAYAIFRRDRDVVHGKPGTTPPKPKSPEKDGEKEKKPFEDRVLNKALDYIRGQLKKVSAVRAAMESGDA